MRIQERLARELHERLEAEGLAVTTSGRGVFWTVTATADARSVSIDCAWHDSPGPGFERRERRGNAHLFVRTGPPRPVEGADYLLSFSDDEERASGNTSDPGDVAGATAAWLSGIDRDDLRRAWAFVDPLEKAAATLAAATGVPVTCQLRRDGLWLHAGSRSTLVIPDARDVRVAFLARGVQLGRGYFPTSEAAAPPVGRWLEGAQTAELGGMQGVSLEPHHELFEAGRYAEWGWVQHLEAARDPSEPNLRHNRRLIEAIAASPVVSRYFGFLRGAQLCLSRSSHHPFDTGGLPRITPLRGGGWVLVWGTERHEGDEHAIVDLLEARLPAAPTPYLGNYDVSIHPVLEAITAGTELEVGVRKDGARELLGVTHPRTERRCVVHAGPRRGPGRLVFLDGDVRVGEAVPDGMEETGDLLVDWLEAEIAPRDLAASASDWRGMGRRQTEPGAPLPV